MVENCAFLLLALALGITIQNECLRQKLIKIQLIKDCNIIFSLFGL